MVRHIVVWKLKDEADGRTKAENALRVKAALEGLRPFFPDALIEVGIDMGAVANTWDVAIYSEFPDEAALVAYQVHPEHVRVAGFVRELIELRAGIDFEAQVPCC